MKLATILFSLTLSILTYSQPTYQWSVNNSGSGYEYGNAIEVDITGNVITIGQFKSQVDFDPGAGVYNLSPVGNEDVFVQKLDAAGNFVWAFQIGGVGVSQNFDDDNGWDVVTDANGNVFVTGVYGGTADFDPGAGTYNLTSNGNSDVFVAKYNPNGNLIWAKSIGGSNIDMATTVDVDGQGNVIVGGQFWGTVDFDPGVGTVNFTSFSSSSDAFVLKLDSNGDYLWAKVFGDYSSDLAYVSYDNIGNVWVTGRYGGTVDFDPGAGTFNLTSTNSYYSAYAQKLDSNGNFIWATTFNGSLNNEGLGVSTDDNNNVLITGFFHGTTDFDPGASTYNLTAVGSEDAYVLKLSSTGDFNWVTHIGSSGSEQGRSITTDLAGNVYTYGITNGDYTTIDFDPGAGTYYLSSGFGTYVQKLNSQGDLVWAIRNVDAGGSSSAGLEQQGSGIAVTSSEVLLTGYFGGTADFDPSVNVQNMTATANDCFVQKLGQCINTTSSMAETACDTYTAPDGQIYSSTGIYTATIQNSAGCDSVITIDLTINTVDVTTTQLDDITIQANLNGAQYQWVNCDENYSAINGATNQTFVATANGNYAVIVTDGNCSDTSDCVTIDKVSLDELQSVISVFPNPTEQFVTISIDSKLLGTTFTLLDQTGRIVLSDVFDNSQKTIDLEGLDHGVYYLKGDEFNTYKILKY